MTDDRSAIGARRDQVAGFDRPERLNPGFDIRDAVDHVRETAELFKVFQPQWLVSHTSTAPGLAGKEECAQYFLHTFFERVRDVDVRYEATSATHPDRYPYFLKLRLPTVVGEFKTRELAEAFVAEREIPDATVVARNSREEFKLREYSKKKLPASER